MGCCQMHNEKGELALNLASKKKTQEAFDSDIAKFFEISLESPVKCIDVKLRRTNSLLNPNENTSTNVSYASVHRNENELAYLYGPALSGKQLWLTRSPRS